MLPWFRVSSEMPAQTEPRWLTTAELALRWRVTTRTLLRWRVGKYGPAWHVIGGRVLYLFDDVAGFETRHRRKGD
jgi:hypothetical protein